MRYQRYYWSKQGKNLKQKDKSSSVCMKCCSVMWMITAECQKKYNFKTVSWWSWYKHIQHTMYNMYFWYNHTTDWCVHIRDRFAVCMSVPLKRSVYPALLSQKGCPVQLWETFFIVLADTQIAASSGPRGPLHY